MQVILLFKGTCGTREELGEGLSQLTADFSFYIKPPWPRPLVRPQALIGRMVESLVIFVMF